MYINHFGLAQYPFSLTPNTRYFMKMPSHQKAFALLIEAMQSPAAFATITGEVGTGKTMLCRKLISALDAHKNKFVTAYIPHPILDEDAIMHTIADELHLQVGARASYYEVLKLVSAELVRINSSGRQVVLFIDEAQAAPEETLAAVNLLTTLDTDDAKFLQVVLFGQPELITLLQRPALHQVQNQLAFSFVLPALDLAGTEAYINHRLHRAGFNGQHLFTREAARAIYAGSKGVPRMINILAHKAMLSAFGKGDHIINEEPVQRAIADTESARQSHSLARRILADDA